MDKQKIGYIGEMHVLYKLSMMNISAMKLHNSFDFDIYTNNNRRIEVKTSVLRYKKHNSKTNRKDYKSLTQTWEFHNYTRDKNRNYINRNRKCDFFIFVCLNEEQKPIKTYIVPKDVIGEKMRISIPQSNKTMYSNFLEKWESIKDTMEV